MSWLEDILPIAAAVAGWNKSQSNLQQQKDMAKLLAGGGDVAGGAGSNPAVGDFSMNAINNYRPQQAVMPADSNGYNPSADMGADVGSKYAMQIMNAKNQYEMARKNNNMNGMLNANAAAEQARAAANEAGVQLPSYLQSAQSAGYGQALQNLDTLRNAQNAKANGVSLDDFVNGTGQYNFDGNGNGNFSWGNFMKQLNNPTAYLTPQNTAVAQNGTQGTAVPTAAQTSPMNNPNSFTGVDVNAPNAIINGYNNAKKKTNWLMG